MKKLIVLTLAVLFSAGLSFADQEYKFTDSKSYDGSDIELVSLDMSSGDIELVKSSSDKIEVEYMLVVFAEDKEEADDFYADCRFETHMDGNELEIDVEYPRRRPHRNIFNRLFSGDWNHDTGIFLKISVPDNKNIRIKSSSADLLAEDLAGDVDITASSSDLSFKNTTGELHADLSSGDVDMFNHTGNVIIDASSSDINVENLVGNIDIKTTSGDGYLDEIQGNVSVFANSGDYRIFEVDGSVDLKTTSGDIYLNGTSGSLTAESSSGDIRLNGLNSKDGSFYVDSSSGDVSLELSDDFAGKVNLDTNSGSINCFFDDELDSYDEDHVSGYVGDGNGNLRISTSSGDIRVGRF